MSEILSFRTMIDSLPAATSDRLKMMATDNEGEYTLSMMALKCYATFGIARVKEALRSQAKDKTWLRAQLNDTETWWSEHPAASTPPGIIATMSFPVSGEDSTATVYFYTLDGIKESSGQQFRALRPLMVEIPGYPPVWTSKVTI